MYVRSTSARPQHAEVPLVAPTSYSVGMERTTVSSEHTDDVTEASHREEVRPTGERVIVVNSQPSGSDEDLPPKRLRSLGSVAAHATDPVPGDGRPRRGSGRRGRPLLSMLAMAVPLAAAAFGITLLEDRTVILAATAALTVLWLVGIAAAWRGLGPGSRDSRGGVWLGRAIGLVLGALVAVYVLLDTVTPLL